MTFKAITEGRLRIESVTEAIWTRQGKALAHLCTALVVVSTSAILVIAQNVWRVVPEHVIWRAIE
jgi:hypothetical protein